MAILAAIVAVNALVGYAIAEGKTALAVGIASLPFLVLALERVILRRPRVLAYAALGLAMFGDRLNGPLPLPISTVIYPADILVSLAIGSWLIGRERGKEVRRLRTPVLGLPFAIFAVAILVAVIRGHQSYGLAYFSQPVRILVYAGIATAIADSTPRQLYRAIVAIFYVGAAWQAVLAAFYLATGRSQTESIDLSTGGTRTLALSTAMLLACSLVLALLNLDLDWKAGRRAVHLGVAALATFGIVVSLGRTTFAAVAALVPLLLITLRHARRAILSFVPLLLPALVLVAILVPRATPNLVPTLTARLTGKFKNDSALVTRQRKYDAALEGYGKDPILGLGFGRPYTYLDLDRSLKTISGDPENSYVYLLAGGGLFALGSWILLSLTFVWNTLRRLHVAAGTDRVLVLWSLGAWFVLSVNEFTGPILSVPSLLLPLWIALLLPAVVRLDPDSSIPAPAAGEPPRTARSAPVAQESRW